MIEQKITIAIDKPADNPNKPNLGDESVALLKAGGLSFSFKSRVDYARTNIPGLDIRKMRNPDLARATADGEVDLAIVGLDMYQEYLGNPRAKILRPLGFSLCTLKLAVSENSGITDPTDLAGLQVATLYVKSAKSFFRDKGIPIKTRRYAGGEESTVLSEFNKACVVISDTGDSFTANGLKPIANILESEATLIANPKLSEKRGSEKIIWRALRAIMTGIWKTQYTFLKFNYPEALEAKIMKQTPARESPTKMTLDKKGWKAAETLMPIANREKVEDRLLTSGAQDLFYVQVERIVPNLDDPQVTRMMRVIYEKDWNFPGPSFLE